MTRKALIIEDNKDIANLVQMHLRDIQCEADIAEDGAKGLSIFQQGEYDLVVLDLMLPVMDGVSVCQKIRADAKTYVPILMLTAKSTELDRVLGLEVGADDYLTKPFSIPELLARCKALFRRAEAMTGKETENNNSEIETLRYGNLFVDVNKRQVRIGEDNIELTA